MTQRFFSIIKYGFYGVVGIPLFVVAVYGLTLTDPARNHNPFAPASSRGSVVALAPTVDALLPVEPPATITALIIPTRTPIPPTDEAFSEAAAVRLISEGLAFVMPQLRVLEVRVADGRPIGGVRTAIVSYENQLLDESAILLEWTQIFSTTVLSVNGVFDIDNVTVIPADALGNATGVLTADVATIQRFMDGQLTVADFLGTLETLNLSDTSSVPEAQTAQVRLNSSQSEPQWVDFPTAALSGGFICPSNCDGARAMGLSAQQAATCPGLDRDHDGVACYGD